MAESCFRSPSLRIAWSFAIWVSTCCLIDGFLTLLHFSLASPWVLQLSWIVNFSVAFFQLLNPVVVKAVSPFLLKVSNPCESTVKVSFSLYKQTAKDKPCTTKAENFGHFLPTELV